MTAKNQMILWNPGTDQIRVADHPGGGRYREYRMSAGACYFGWKQKTFEQRKCQLAAEALTIAIRDRVPIEAIHEAFSNLDEWRALFPEGEVDFTKRRRQPQ